MPLFYCSAGPLDANPPIRSSGRLSLMLALEHAEVWPQKHRRGSSNKHPPIVIVEVVAKSISLGSKSSCVAGRGYTERLWQAFLFPCSRGLLS
jgi:hypothetical protein